VIKLVDILKETEGEDEYPPYMYSPVGFSCHVCEYYYEKEGKHKCNNKYYIDHMGTEDLINPKTKKPIKDPKKYCSNWFYPKK
jgi:hypothetical protein